MTAFLVTGGTGFLGSALVRKLVKLGHSVRVLDNNSRGRASRLSDILNKIEYIEGDIRDSHAVNEAVKGVECVWHLAYINGTEYFYSKPELVLDVGVSGMVNVLNACKLANVRQIFLASTSEVYQTPPIIPTPEVVPLIVPDPLNPRYSYGGGKIISELMTLNYGKTFFDRAVIFRPHNVYGPDMGDEHVVPQFIRRMRVACAKHPDGVVPFEIQGDGSETRAFVYIDDFIDGLALLFEKGLHLNIYNIGTMHEVAIKDLALNIGKCLGREIKIVPGKLLAGSTLRRCPDTAKIAMLGYNPKVGLSEGLQRIVDTPIVLGEK